MKKNWIDILHKLNPTILVADKVKLLHGGIKVGISGGGTVVLTAYAYNLAKEMGLFG